MFGKVVADPHSLSDLEGLSPKNQIDPGFSTERPFREGKDRLPSTYFFLLPCPCFPDSRDLSYYTNKTASFSKHGQKLNQLSSTFSNLVGLTVS